MNNMDKIKNMTIDELAKRNVYRITISNGDRLSITSQSFLYATSNGYLTNDEQVAIDYELKWLKFDV
jgi:hypothetical protein